MNPQSPLVIVVALVSIALASCSTSGSGDAQTIQGRKEFELLRHRNPATGRLPENIRARELAFAHTMPGAYSQKDEGEHVQDLGQWKHRGPWNVGGRTRAASFDVNNVETILSSSVSGGMWKSNDDGASWVLTTKPDQLHSITTLAQDRRTGRGNTWYYGTGEVYGNSAQISGNGIWKSIDNGNSWSVLPSTASIVTPATNQFAYTWRIVTHPLRDSDEVYAATSRSGLYRSTNGGTTWTSVAGSNALFSDIVITPNGTMYSAFSAFTGSLGSISSRWGVYRSTDGVKWTKITPAGIDNQTGRIILASVPQHPDQIFMLAETPGVGAKGSTLYRGELRYEWHSLFKYTYVSGDGTGVGGQWDDRTANIPLTDEKRGDFYSQGGYDLLLRVSPFDSNLVVIGGTNLYRSTDGFSTTNTNAWIGGYWKPDPFWDGYSLYPNHHPDQHDVVFHPTKPNVLVSMNDGGIQRTEDVRATEVTWTDLNRGYLTTQFYTVAADLTTGADRILGGMQDNATWATDSTSFTAFWRRLGGGDGAYCYFADSGRTEYYSSQQGRMFRIRRDAAGNEVDRSRIDPAGAGNNYLFINPYILHPNEEQVCYLAAGPILWRNRDLRDIPAGKNDSTTVNWDSLPTTRLKSEVISALCSPGNPSAGLQHVVYYGTTSGRIFRIDDALSALPTPIEITSPSMTRGAYVNNITVDKGNANHVLCCFSNYGVVSVWESYDKGTSWVAISGNLEDQVSGEGSGPAVHWIESLNYGASNPSVLIVATSTGLYFTPNTNGMSTVWTQTATELIGNVSCDMLFDRRSRGDIVVATHGRGVISGGIVTLPPRPRIPLLVSPVDGRKGILIDTVLTWEPVVSAMSYSLTLWETDDLATKQTFTGIRTESFRVSELRQGPVRYSWNVEAFSGGGGGTPSDTWSFYTAVRSPKLLLPLASSTGILQAILTWQRVPEAQTYGIELSTSAAFNPIISKQSGIVDTSILVRGLENNRRYFWRARSENSDAMGVFSARQSFVTGLLASLDDVAPSATTTLHVEPNPVSDIVTVCMGKRGSGTKAEGHRTEISIHDANGRLVRVAFVTDCATINVADLASGIYAVTTNNTLYASSTQLIIKH